MVISGINKILYVLVSFMKNYTFVISIDCFVELRNNILLSVRGVIIKKNITELYRDNIHFFLFRILEIKYQRSFFSFQYI